MMRKNIGKQDLDDGGYLIYDLTIVFHTLLIQQWEQLVIAEQTGVVNGLLAHRLIGLSLGFDENAVRLDLHLGDLAILQHLLELVVFDLLHHGFCIAGIEKVEEKNKRYSQNGDGQDGIKFWTVLVVPFTAVFISAVVWRTHGHASFV